MNTSIKYVILAGVASVFVFGAISVAPIQANACIKALGFLDPLCVISGDADLPSLPSLPELPGLPGIDGDDDAPQTVNNTYTYTNSNNVNSNINSPGASTGGAPIAYYPAPVYNYDYNYNYDYDHYNDYGQLQVSCYPMPLTIDEGERVTWRANAYGGTGSYHYSWDGTDGLDGTGQSITKRYNYEGYKNATVTVRSGNQTVHRNCDGSVYVQDDDYNHGYPYYPDYNNTYPLSVSCSAQVTSAGYGTSVRWNAFVSGGTGSYGYSWTGTDGLVGSAQSVYRTYTVSGQKYASVTVWSGGQTVTRNCTNNVTVGNYGGYYPYPTSQGGLDIACYSDPRTVTVNQPATWITEVSGGIAPYTYSWTGTDGLTGSASSITKYYAAPGSKSAIVTITSVDGRSETRACSTSITVRSAYEPVQQPVVQPDQDQDEDTSLSAAALFSLKNVPWGWVAILVILVLFGTIIYLIYNRPKI